MFKRNNSLQCKSKAHLSHIYMARGLSPLSVCSVRESNPRDRIQPQRYFALSRARSKSLRNYILIRLIALYNVGNYAKLNPNKTCGHFCIVRWLGRGTFFWLKVYERVGILLVEVYEREGKSVIWVCERGQRAKQMNFMAL